MTDCIRLEETANDLVDLTYARCRKSCGVLGFCCEDTICQGTYDFLKTCLEVNKNKDPVKQVDLDSVLHATELLDKLTEINKTHTGGSPRYLVDNKCIVPAWARFQCSVHQCDIASYGFFTEGAVVGDRILNKHQATLQYFTLRETFDKLLYQLFFNGD